MSATSAGAMLQIGTNDGIFTVEIREDDRGELFAASLRGSLIRAIAVDPADPGIMIVGCGAPGAGLYYSRDGGLTWEAPGFWPLGHEVLALAFSPRDSRVILAGTQPPGIYRSQDHGYTWESLPAICALPGYRSWDFPYAPYQAHLRSFAFDPDNPNRVAAAIEVGGVVSSDDEGRTWESVNGEIDRDVHDVAFGRGDGDLLLAATGKGLFRRHKQGGWLHVPRQLVGDYVVALETRTNEPRTIYTVGRENSFAVIAHSDDGGIRWQRSAAALPAPDFGRGALAPHPSDPETVFYGANDPVDVDRGCVFVSHDTGQSWTKIAFAVSLPMITRLAACC